MDTSSDFDLTQALVLEDLDDDDLTDELKSSEEKKPAAYIKVLFQKGLTETTYPLYEGDNIIGRHADTCHVCIPSKSLSKEHACIQITADSHLISDKSSRNKTRRGKLLLRPEVWYELKHGDEIMFADVRCTYEISEQVTDAVAETDSDTDTSESLLLHHDVTEEHSFNIAHKHQNMSDQPTCYTAGNGNSSEVPETQVFSESEDEEKSKNEAVQETLLFEDSDPETSREVDMFPAATQAYIVQGDNKDIDGEDSADEPTEAATQAYDASWQSLEEEIQGNEPTQLFVQPDKLLKAKKEALNSVLESSSPLVGTQSFEAEAKSSNGDTVELEETAAKNSNQTDSTDSVMRPTQVFDENDDDDTKDADELFAVSTVPYDRGDDNVGNDECDCVNNDGSRPTQVMDLDNSIQKTVTKQCGNVSSVNNKCIAIATSTEHIKTVLMEPCPTTITASLSAEVPADETQPAETSADTSRTHDSENSEDVPTQVFDRTIYTDSPKQADHDNKRQERNRQQNNNPNDAAILPPISSLVVSGQHCRPRRERNKVTQQTTCDQPTQTFRGASDEPTQTFIPDNEECDLAETSEECQKTDHNKQNVSDEDNDLSRNSCVIKGCSEESTQAYGIEEDSATQMYGTDSAHGAEGTFEEPTQACSPEEADATQIFVENGKEENRILTESDNNEGATQIFCEEGTSNKFDIIEENPGIVSDATTEKVSGSSAGPSKAYLHSDDDSDLEDTSVLRSNTDEADHLFHCGRAAMNVSTEPTLSHVTFEEKSGKLSENEKLGNGNGDDKKVDTLSDPDEVVPDSMADETDKRSPVIPLPLISPLKAALPDMKRSPSLTCKQTELPEKEEDEEKPVEGRRSTRGQAALLLQESDEVNSSSPRLRRARNKRIISQATCSAKTQSQGGEILAEDKSKAKPLIENKKEQKRPEIMENLEASDSDKCEVEHKSPLDKQKKVIGSPHGAGRRKRSARTENIIPPIPATEGTSAVSESRMRKTRAKRGKMPGDDEQETDISKSGNEKEEIRESGAKKTRRSVAFKTQVLDVIDTADNRTRLKNLTSDHEDCINRSEQKNMALAQSEVEKEDHNSESDETASIESFVNDVDREKIENIKDNRKRRRQTREKINKEDFKKSEINIDSSTGPRVSSRGRHLSTNPYLKDFDTDIKKDKQRKSLLVSQGKETLTENEMQEKEVVSEMTDLGKGKMKKISGVSRSIGHESNSCVETLPPVGGRSEQIITIENSRNDIKHSEVSKASKFECSGKDKNKIEIKQEKTVKSSRTRGKHVLSEKVGRFQLSDNSQADISVQSLKRASKGRRSVKNSLSESSASNKNNSTDEHMLSTGNKMCEQDGNPALQTLSAESPQQMKAQNVNVSSEFQTFNRPPAESQPVATTMQLNPRGRGRKSVPAESGMSRVAKNSKSLTRLSKNNSTDEHMLSTGNKMCEQDGNPALQTLSAESPQQMKAQNVNVSSEFQTFNRPPAESQPVATTMQLNPRGRGRKSVPAESGMSRVAKNSKSLTRLSRDTGKKVAATDQASVSPAKKSKLMSSPQTPVGKTEIFKENLQSPTLRKSSTSHKPRVMFTGLIDEHGEKIVKDLGGEMASSIQECTHLVTDRVRRTVKFLSGLAKGLLIVSPRWLESSKLAGTFIDGHMFLISDPAMEKQYKFNLATSINKAQGSPMLTGYRVHVSKSVRPDPAQMQDVLKCAGAEFLKTMPSKPHDNTVVISCLEDFKLCQPAIKAGIPVVEAEFILTGILRQELDYKSFALSAEQNSSQPSGRSKTSR